MSDIAISAGVRQNLLSLQSTADMMSETQNRLATGKKVNSALDNPSNFFTSSSLNSRASDMNALMDGMANGIKTLEAADNGLSAITKTLESMQSTLRQARQDKSFETGSFSLSESATGSISFSKGAIGDTAQSTSLQNSVTTGNSGFGVNGTAGADGTITIASDSLDADIDVDFASGDTASTAAQKINEALGDAEGGNGGITASVNDGQLQLTNANGDAVTVTGGQRLGLTAGSAATATESSLTGTVEDTYVSGTINVGGVDVTIPAGGGAGTGDANATAAAGAITDALSEAGVTGITATATTGSLEIAKEDGTLLTISGDADVLQGLGLGDGTETSVSDEGVTAVAEVTSISTADVTKSTDALVSEINSNANLEGKIRASNDDGKLRIENQSTQELTINGISSSGSVTGADNDATIAGNSVRAGLAEQYNELRDQLDKLADDASYNGVNLLRGDNLQITFNETGTSELNIQTEGGETINSANLGIPTEMNAADFDSDSSIDGFLQGVKTAINDVRAQSSSFGSSLSIVENRSDFTTSMVNTLETGADNLTLADSNEEAANLLALQTRQQLSSTALSMASQQDQAVLRLF